MSKVRRFRNRRVSLPNLLLALDKFGLWVQGLYTHPPNLSSPGPSSASTSAGLDAAQELRRILERYAEVSAKCTNLKFRGCYRPFTKPGGSHFTYLTAKANEKAQLCFATWFRILQTPRRTLPRSGRTLRPLPILRPRHSEPCRNPTGRRIFRSHFPVAFCNSSF